MIFFEFAESVKYIILPYGAENSSQALYAINFALLIGALCFLIVYIFQSVGLYIISRREGYDHKWMAFVPFFSTYYIGVCGQKNRFFKLDTKKIAIAVAAIEFAVVVLYVFSYVAEVYLWKHELMELLESADYVVLGETYTLRMWGLPQGFISAYPELTWAWVGYEILPSYVTAIIELIYLFAIIVILSCFFQTYSTGRYLLFTIFSVLFPIQGILIFAVRNNKGMSYAEYTRMVQERMYRQYRSQQGYRDPYNQNTYNGGYSGYNNPPQQPSPEQPQNAPEDPFAEFGKKGGNDSPFDDFKN